MKKIAIASEGQLSDSMMSSKGARAPYYLIFENKILKEYIKNPFVYGGGGAGYSVASMLKDKGINMFIAGEIGENMVSALKSKNILYKKESPRKVKDIIESL